MVQMLSILGTLWLTDCVRCETESTQCTDDPADSMSATSVECAKADDVQGAVPEPSKSSQDSSMSSDVDTQQSTLGQFLLLDNCISIGGNALVKCSVCVCVCSAIK